MFQFLYPLRGWKLVQVVICRLIDRVVEFQFLYPLRGWKQKITRKASMPNSVSIPLPLTGMETFSSFLRKSKLPKPFQFLYPLRGWKPKIAPKAPAALGTVSIPLPLTGMETLVFISSDCWGNKWFQFLYPLRGWKLIPFSWSAFAAPIGFNSFTPYGDGNQ